jgi:uncharacterized protein YceH (UPF0502 family)
MDFDLDDVEVRVLGSLLEKEITTPEYYPLSLNALLNACNQKSNREPVVSYDEERVLAALDRLRERGLALISTGGDNRVPKYLERLAEKFNFDRRELAVLCVLLLRGPQTPGELRGRTQRMHEFDDLDAIESCLNRLMERDPAVVKKLARQAGSKESRYAHLLGGDVSEAAPAAEIPERPRESDRIARLETLVEEPRRELDDLKRQLGVT